jgi:hypothetical protein
MNPRWPIYIVSKGRAKTRLTMRSLDEINVPYFVVVDRSDGVGGFSSRALACYGVLSRA